MKVHYDGYYGVRCHTSRTRSTTHSQRITKDADKVTCDKCRKLYGFDRYNVKQAHELTPA